MTTIKPLEIESKESLSQLMEKESLVALFFSSPECGVCHAVLPRLTAMMEEYSVKIATIDISRLLEIAGQHLVFTVPTILLIQNGREILRESRFIDFYKLERILKRYSAGNNY